MNTSKALTVLLLLAFSVTICGCAAEGDGEKRLDEGFSSGSEQISRSVSTPELDQYKYLFEQAVDKVTDTNNHPTNWDIYLSPDGVWLAGGIRAVGDSIKIVSISNPESMINIGDDSKDLYQEFISWSPDGTILVTQGTKQSGKCAFDRVILYHLEKGQQVKGITFEIPIKENRNCYSAKWSPDGSKLAIGGSDIFILDRNGGLINQITFDAPYSLRDLYWIDTQTILFVVRYPKYELHVRNMVSGEEQILISDNKYFSLVDYDPDTRRVLIGARVDGENRLRLREFSINNNRIVKEIDLQGYMLYQPIVSMPSRWIGFTVDVPSLGGKRHLYLFDWRHNDLNDYGEVTYLLGWWRTINGFVIVKNDDENHVELVIPRP
jgi:WD40 repeat protein